jgi:hypothetical protein
MSKLNGESEMLKEATGLAGGALLFSPLGMPVLFHGLSGIVVGGAGLFVANAVVKQVKELLPAMPSPLQPEVNQSEE